MKMLAIDSATEILSVALGTDQGTWTASADAGLRHSEILMDLADGLLRLAGLAPEDLDAVACMKGPGSFTGLRIGFASAKGLALALGIPFAAVPTLDCMALPFSPLPFAVLPVIDAKKRRFFTALYRGSERLTGFMDGTPDEIVRILLGESEKNEMRGVIITGPAAEMIYTDLSSALGKVSQGGCLYPVFPNRRGWSVELLEMAKKQTFDADELNGGPEYIRKSDAELNLDGKAGCHV
jgi:tRNA threonylcarbamoyladenosine biosynthesis protein TsaB